MNNGYRVVITSICSFILLAFTFPSSSYGASPVIDVGLNGTITTTATGSTIQSGDKVTLKLDVVNTGEVNLIYHLYHYFYIDDRLTLDSTSSDIDALTLFDITHISNDTNIPPELHYRNLYVFTDQAPIPPLDPGESKTIYFNFTSTQTINSGTTLFYIHSTSAYVYANDVGACQTEFSLESGECDESENGSWANFLNSYFTPGGDPDSVTSNDGYAGVFTGVTQQSESNSNSSTTSTNATASNSSNSSRSSNVSGSKGTNTQANTATGSASGTDLTNASDQETLSEQIELAQGLKDRLPKRVPVTDKDSKILFLSPTQFKWAITLLASSICLAVGLIPVRRWYITTIQSQRQYRTALKIDKNTN